jgi:hypothetical protein
VTVPSEDLPKNTRRGGSAASTTARIAARVAAGSPGSSAHESANARRTAA